MTHVVWNWTFWTRVAWNSPVCHMFGIFGGSPPYRSLSPVLPWQALIHFLLDNDEYRCIECFLSNRLNAQGCKRPMGHGKASKPATFGLSCSLSCAVASTDTTQHVQCRLLFEEKEAFPLPLFAYQYLTKDHLCRAQLDTAWTGS
jgi:hypothetical protein